jgi:thiamine biosynthesis lipoprotein
MSRAVLALALLCAMAVTAVAAPAKLTYSGKAMGTYVTVWFWTDKEADAAKAAESVFAEMKRLDQEMTTWTDTSEVSKINAAAGKSPVAVSDETFAVIERAQDIAK